MVELNILINNSNMASFQEEKRDTKTVWTHACFIKKNSVTMLLLLFTSFLTFIFTMFDNIWILQITAII